jgi:hypothetical protein
LSDSAYFEKLHRLRASNARYLPLSREEVLHHLRRAQVVDGAVVETPELATLRQYYASCLLDTHLQRPAPSTRRPPMGEIQLFAGLYLATSTAMLALWSEPSGDFADAEARATWLLTSLWQDATALVGTFSDALAGGLDDGMFGMGLAHLIVQGVSLPGKSQWPPENGPTPRALYVEWLERTFSFVGRERRRTLVEGLRRDFEDRGWLDHQDERVRQAQRAFLGEFFDELPRSIRDAVPLSRETLAFLGLERFTATRIDELEFEYRVFWRAAERAWRGRPAKIHPRNRDMTVNVAIEKADGGAQPRLVFTQPGRQRRGVHDDPLLVLLDPDPLVRRRCLDQHREWFDCEEDDFRRHADRIAALRCTHERIRQAISARAEAPALIYAELRAALGRGETGEKPFLPPPLRRLLAHLRLRLSRDADAEAALGNAAVVLLRELGLEETICRLSSLPSALPEHVLAAFDALSTEEAEALLARIETRLQQPFARLLLARLSLRQARRCGAEPSKARGLVREVLDASSAPRFEAFLAIARWAVRRIAERDRASGATSGALLAATWLHASELFNALAAHEPRWEGLRESFSDRSNPRTEFFFAFDETLQSEAAHPRTLDRVTTIIHACAATVLAEDPSIAADFGIAAFAEAGFFTTEEGQRAPQLNLREEPSSLPNSIHSFLGEDRGVALGAAIGEEAAAPFLAATWHDQVHEAIDGTRSQPLGTGYWPLLSLFLATRPAPTKFHESLGELLRSISLQTIVENPPTAWQMLLIFCARQARDLGGETAAHIKAELIAMAHKLATQPDRADEGAREWATFLFEAARILALGGTDENARAHSFANTTGAILRAWPACAVHVRRIITFLSFRLPPRQAAELRITRSLALAQPARV